MRTTTYTIPSSALSSLLAPPAPRPPPSVDDIILCAHVVRKFWLPRFISHPFATAVPTENLDRGCTDDNVLYSRH